MTSVVSALFMSNVLGLIAAINPTMTTGIPDRVKQYMLSIISVLFYDGKTCKCVDKIIISLAEARTQSYPYTDCDNSDDYML